VYFTDNKADTSFFKVSKKMPKIPILVRWVSYQSGKLASY
jgi:hypothetical protein